MTIDPLPELKRPHAKRLREIYLSVGWPSLDVVEIELLAAGMLERVRDAAGLECVRVTDAGIQYLAATAQVNRTALSAHQALVNAVAQVMQRDGRLVWTALALRARIPPEGDTNCYWKMCQPDVYSIRNSSKQSFLEPIVHEIKVSRADLMGDLKLPDKRRAYLDVGGQCWYVLGRTAKGKPIAEPEEVPSECSVMLQSGDRFEVLRGAPKREMLELPFGVWMALAKATPHQAPAEQVQAHLS
jgi:hypothetical protein